MPDGFDPVRRRERYEKSGFFFSSRIEPGTSFYHSNVMAVVVAEYAEAVLLGLEAQARPLFERALAVMEERGGPLEPGETEPIYWFGTSFQWWTAFGLARWLMHGDRAEQCFGTALDVHLGLYEVFKSVDHGDIPRKLRWQIGKILGVALNADAPKTGLLFYEQSGLKAPGFHDRQQRTFGLWACRSLAAGGTRDGTFVAKGTAMLQKHLASPYGMTWAMPTELLWLKTVYFDSGIVATPRAAILKAYDVLGIERPAFVRD